MTLLSDKVEGIKNIAVSTTKKLLQSFIDIFKNMDLAIEYPSQVKHPNKPNGIGVKNIKRDLIQLKS